MLGILNKWSVPIRESPIDDPILGHQDAVLRSCKGEIEELCSSVDLFDSNLIPNPNRPLFEQISSEVHAVEVREQKLRKIERHSASHPKRINHALFRASVSLW